MLFILGQTEGSNLPVDQLLNIGITGVILVFVGAGFWKAAKWAAEVIRYAILDPENGALALAKRHVVNTETFMHEMGLRDEKQQELCQLHAENLKNLNTLVECNRELTDGVKSTSQQIREDIEQWREEVMSPNMPYSTVETNKKLDGIRRAIAQACKATREIVEGRSPPDVVSEVRHNCELIESLLT